MLNYPLDYNDQKIIEGTKFTQLKADKIYGGLPILTAAPSYKGTSGEHLLTMTGTHPSEVYRHYAYMADGSLVFDWRQLGGTDYATQAYVLSIAYIFTSGDQLVISADTIRSTNATSYTKIKEIVMNYGGSSIKIKFDMIKNQIGSSAYGRIYKNDVAIGGEHVITNQNDGAYITYTDSLGTFYAGDKFQLYIKCTNPSYESQIRNFRIYKLADATVNTD
jgi:hypothetical protein